MKKYASSWLVMPRAKKHENNNKKRLRDNNKPQFAALSQIRQPCATIERPKSDSNNKKKKQDGKLVILRPVLSD
jgi:hypothetical protein